MGVRSQTAPESLPRVLTRSRPRAFPPSLSSRSASLSGTPTGFALHHHSSGSSQHMVSAATWNNRNFGSLKLKTKTPFSNGLWCTVAFIWSRCCGWSGGCGASFTCGAFILRCITGSDIWLANKQQVDNPTADARARARYSTSVCERIPTSPALYLSALSCYLLLFLQKSRIAPLTHMPVCACRPQITPPQHAVGERQVTQVLPEHEGGGVSF